MNPRAAAPLLLLLAVALGACGGSGGTRDSTPAARDDPAAAKVIQRNPANARTTLTVASKNFTEEFILGEIYAQALQAGGYKVRKRLNVGPERVAYRAIRSRRIDASPEYTSRALTTFFGVRTDEIPKDEQEAYDQAGGSFAAQGLTALPPTPF